MRLTRVTLFFLALIIGFGFYRLFDFLLDDIDAQTLQATEEVMVDTAHVMAGMIENELKEGKEQDIRLLRGAFSQAQSHTLEAKIHKLTKTRIGLNAYLTDSKGIVIFDSDNGRREGQDLSRYNDVLRTLNGGYGARSSREDDNNPDSSILYVAAPVKSDDTIIAVLTIYKPQADVLNFITDRRRDILTAILSIGGGVILLTGAVFIWLFQPIGRLTCYARSISKGERLPIPSLGKGKEVNTLGKALHNMRETLEGRRYVENYVSTLTHELKSPMAAIKGAAELLEEDMPADKRQRFLTNIQRETARSESLIKDLLRLVELERKPHLEHKRSINLARLCHEITNECSHRLIVKNLSLKCTFQESIHISGDTMMLRLALINLLDNAIGFSPNDKAIMFNLEKSDTHVQVSITDQGLGLPDYAEQRVFEHFYSLTRPGSDQKGTGLGLPLVREAIKLHGGEVSLENHPSGGCVATILIPHSVS